METEQVKILAQNKDQLRRVLDRIKEKGVQLTNVRIYRASDLDKMSIGSTHTLKEAGKKILFSSLTGAAVVILAAFGMYFFYESEFFNSKNFLYMIPLFGLIAAFITSIFAGQAYAASHEKDIELSKSEVERARLVLGIEYDPSQKNLVRQVIGHGRKVLL